MAGSQEIAGVIGKFGHSVQDVTGQNLAELRKIERVKMERVTVYLGSKITGDSGYSRIQSLNGVQLFATP